MAPLKILMRFHCFGSLPGELRQQIWRESLATAMNRPEVLVLVPSMFKNNPSPQPLSVNTAFPVAMHVNSESRAIALMHIEMGDLGDPSRGCYLWIKCRVPQRLFRPEIDILYIPRSLDPDRVFPRNELAKVQHLAIDFSRTISRDVWYLVENKLRYMPALRTLRLVLPSAQMDYYHPLESRPMWPDMPRRRCAIRVCQFEELLGVTVTTTDFPLRPEGERISCPAKRLLWENNPMLYMTSGTKSLPLRALMNYLRDDAWLAARVVYGFPGSPNKDEKYMKQFMDFEKGELKIVIKSSLITEYCYSPSGDSRFVAKGEECPDDIDPSILAKLTLDPKLFE
ncbi:hypothetical protein HD806DRAFT_527396 [Xylariaceae sp. AK1471]|nr:hypothetical protein HD806DRAFT_527396 [Xylariaceae sp. AK1471]